eukprot:TRINITY_DN53309_c0_g1_i1.p1 TRINITY_DN53309_c0_g1~~TRINITY_DN53309_c0_g1_i1.p1  ORF type:complete len:161 (+),score=27.76 TRINITY_DN53309_c0_g1_i1:1533-2015(+)
MAAKKIQNHFCRCGDEASPSMKCAGCLSHFCDACVEVWNDDQSICHSCCHDKDRIMLRGGQDLPSGMALLRAAIPGKKNDLVIPPLVQPAASAAARTVDRRNNDCYPRQPDGKEHRASVQADTGQSSPGMMSKVPDEIEEISDAGDIRTTEEKNQSTSDL